MFSLGSPFTDYGIKKLIQYIGPRGHTFYIYYISKGIDNPGDQKTNEVFRLALGGF